MKAACLFRLLNPRSEVRAAGGRELNLGRRQADIFNAVNSIFVNGYLTTAGWGMGSKSNWNAPIRRTRDAHTTWGGFLVPARERRLAVKHRFNVTHARSALGISTAFYQFKSVTCLLNEYTTLRKPTLPRMILRVGFLTVREQTNLGRLVILSTLPYLLGRMTPTMSLAP